MISVQRFSSQESVRFTIKMNSHDFGKIIYVQNRACPILQSKLTQVASNQMFMNRADWASSRSKLTNATMRKRLSVELSSHDSQSKLSYVTSMQCAKNIKYVGDKLYEDFVILGWSRGGGR